MKTLVVSFFGAVNGVAMIDLLVFLRQRRVLAALEKRMIEQADEDRRRMVAALEKRMKFERLLIEIETTNPRYIENN